MSIETKRAERIAAMLVRIAPGEENVVRVVAAGNDTSLVAWSFLPTPIFTCVLVLTQDGMAFPASFFFKLEGEDEESKLQQTDLVATTHHTDDEVARKLLVHGLGLLRTIASNFEEQEMEEPAQLANAYANEIQASLDQWGAGSTSAYEGPGGNGITQPATAAGSQPHSPAAQLAILKSRATMWLVVNIAMVILGLIITVWSYDSAQVGDRFVIWWGPVIFGAFNAIRLGVRIGKISAAERSIASI